MQEILDAILAEQYDAVGALDIPDHYRGVTVHADEVGMFEGMPSREKDPRKSLHVDDVPTPELGPGEAIVAVMASAINYNTVWTSIFEPLPTFGFLKRYGRLSPLTKRHDLPYHVVGLGPGRRRAAHRARGERLEAGRPGRRALPLGRAREPRRAQRHDDGPRAAHLGLRDELRRSRRAGSGQVQPAHADARAPHLGGGRGPRPGQLHGLPPARLAQRRGHEAGRHRADLGRLGRPGLLRHPVRAQRRRHPRLRGLLAGEGRDRAPDGRRVRDRPQRRGLQVLARRAHPGPARVEAVRGEDPRADRRRRPGHRLRAPRPRDLRRQRLRRAQGRHDRDLRIHQRVHARVRQPLPVDEPQADHRLALRQLPRGVGGQPADRQGSDPPHAVEGLPARRDRPGRARRPPQPPPGQGRRARARAARRDWASSTTSGARSTSTRSTASAGSRSTTQPSPGGERRLSPPG